MPTPDLQTRDDEAIDPASVPGLIVPVDRTPRIDLSNPEDAPDRPDGEWSKMHLLKFLARQPRDVVYIPRDPWDPKDGDAFAVVGLQGHWFHIRKGTPESVPVQIAEVINNSQKEFPTAQSQRMKRQITDIRDLAPDPAARGLLGAEAPILR